jgi:hypothetical protein
MTDAKSEMKEIYPELQKIENDIQSIKILLVKRRKIPRKIAKLEGLLNTEVSEKDIESAKKSIFNFSD